MLKFSLLRLVPSWITYQTSKSHLVKLELSSVGVVWTGWTESLKSAITGRVNILFCSLVGLKCIISKQCLTPISTSLCYFNMSFYWPLALMVSIGTVKSYDGWLVPDNPLPFHWWCVAQELVGILIPVPSVVCALPIYEKRQTGPSILPMVLSICGKGGYGCLLPIN